MGLQEAAPQKGQTPQGVERRPHQPQRPSFTNKRTDRADVRRNKGSGRSAPTLGPRCDSDPPDARRVSPRQSCWGSSWLSQVVPGDRRTWGELKAKTAGPRGWERPVGLGLHLAAAETLPTHQPSPRLSQAACTTVPRADPAATAPRRHRTPGCGCALPGEHQHQLAPTLAEQKWQL